MNTLSIPVGETVRYSVTDEDVQKIREILQANHISERGIPARGTVLPMLVTESQNEQVRGQLFLNGPCLPFFAESSKPGNTDGPYQNWRQQPGEWLPRTDYSMTGGASG